MGFRRVVIVAGAAASGLAIVAGCSGGSKGNDAPATVVTATATATVTSGSPATGTAAPPSSTAASTPPAGATSRASGPGLCTPTVMTFDVTRNDPAAGSSFFSIHATNASAAPCVTTGFPGIAFLDAAGKQILQAARDDPDTVTTIVVAPGEEVTSRVQVSNAGDGTQICPTSPAFLLTMPDNTDSTKITHQAPACTASVGAFVKGAGNG